MKTNLEKAVGHAEPFLERSDDVEIMDFKALALCGLAICNNDKTSADKARETFAHTRAVTKARGQVERVLKLLDLMEAEDKKGVLAGVRETAAGAK